MKLEPIITSLLDTDLYKFNMDQVIFHKHTDLSGEYYFRCRNEGIVFTPEMFEEMVGNAMERKRYSGLCERIREAYGGSAGTAVSEEMPGM